MLEVTNLNSGYGESIVLRDISIRVPDKTVVTIMGSNGTGKSTLLKTIMGIIKPVSGEISYGDTVLTKKPTYARSINGIGYVPQGRDIFPFLSVHENLILGLTARGLSNAKKEQKAFEMYESFPALQSLKKRRGGDLSGGQQQILALARMMILEPKLLILDEPTEGIQPSIVDAIEDAIGRIARSGVSVLLVEQFADFALSHASYYYVLSHGSIEKEGSVTTENRDIIRASISI